jgi:hypothetical protein
VSSGVSRLKGENDIAPSAPMARWIAYAARGRNSLWRYIVATPLALLIAIALGVVLELALMFSRLGPPGLIVQANDPSHPGPYFAGVFVTFGLVLAGFAAALRSVHGKRFTDMLGSWRWGAFSIGALVWLVAQVLATGADFAVAPSALRISVTSGSLLLALFAVPALSLQTFTEEFVFRGYVTQALALALRRPWLTSAASGVIFGLAHIANGAPQAIGAVMFGVVIAYAAIRTGGLAFGFGVHLANNLFGGVVVVSDADVFKGAPALVTEHASGLVWWDLGVEAALLALLALLVTRLFPDRPTATGAAASLATESV